MHVPSDWATVNTVVAFAVRVTVWSDVAWKVFGVDDIGARAAVHCSLDGHSERPDEVIALVVIDLAPIHI